MTTNLGFGCSGAWGLPMTPRRRAIGLVCSALERGLRIFDTAPFYAKGEAERRLGAALGEVGVDTQNIFISTKTGTRTDAFGGKEKDFSATAIRADVETSLRNLRRERIDLLYLHGPTPVQIDAAQKTLDTLRREGKIGAAGVCGAGAELSHAVGSGAFQAIMAPFNILHREHEELFAQAKVAGMQTYAAAPLAQALYRNSLFTPRSGADLWYLARAVVKNRRDISAARKLNAVQPPSGWSRAQLALAFVVGNPNIDCAIVNTTRTAHLDEAVSARRAEPPANALAAMLAALDGTAPAP